MGRKLRVDNAADKDKNLKAEESMSSVGLEFFGSSLLHEKGTGQGGLLSNLTSSSGPAVQKTQQDLSPKEMFDAIKNMKVWVFVLLASE